MVGLLVSCYQYQNRDCPTSAVHVVLFIVPVVSGFRVVDSMGFPCLSKHYSFYFYA